MRHAVLFSAAALVAATVSVADPTPAAAQGTAQPAPDQRVEMREWVVPWKNTRPRDPMRDPASGRVWFVGQEGNYVATLDPGTGAFKRYAIDDGTFPHDVIVDAHGDAWYAGNRNAMIGRLDGATGAITRYPMPDPAARDPHTLAFDGRGGIWFTVQGGNRVGRLDTRSGRIKLVSMPTPNARPYGIVVDTAGRPWFAQFGTNRIGTIDPRTMALREFPLPNERSRPRRIALTSDGTVWYVDYTRGMLGRLDPRTGKVREWANPGGAASLPYAMTVDDRDRLWFVETGTQPNRLVGFDPKVERFVGVTPIGSGGGTVRHMTYDRATGTIWFGTDAGTIGRAVVRTGPIG